MSTEASATATAGRRTVERPPYATAFRRCVEASEEHTANSKTTAATRHQRIIAKPELLAIRHPRPPSPEQGRASHPAYSVVAF